ncbi:MAG: M55 family metallopeptidase [bacterium]|nr:M55 family metallopeptidase [bacterium]
MKIFISVDAEGLCGISSWHEADNADKDYLRFRRLATKEVNTVCSAIRFKFPKSKIVVCDSHSQGENLLIEELVPDIELVKGFPRPYYMMESIDSTFDGVMFLGYHSKIGSEKGGMDHSYSSSSIYRIKVNGKEMGEVELNGVLAGYYGVPVILVSGDNILGNDVKKHYKEIIYVTTKEGISRFSSKSYPLNKVYDALEKGTFEALSRIRKIPKIFMKPPYKIEIDFFTTIQADVVGLIPCMKRKSGRTLSFTVDDYCNFYRMFMAIILLASTAKTMG